MNLVSRFCLCIAVCSATFGCSLFRAEEEEFERERALQEEIIRRQQDEMERQQRELEDLRRQQYHNQRLREFES